MSLDFYRKTFLRLIAKKLFHNPSFANKIYMKYLGQQFQNLSDFKPTIISPGNSLNSQLNLSCNPGCSVLTDFSQYYKKNNKFLLLTPGSEKEMIDLIILISKLKIEFRLRGNGHSLNSLSLPRHEEVLISTKNLKQLDLSNHKHGYIEVGSGWSLHGLNFLLRSKGYELPVVSDGSDLGSPTIAGFIVGGGISSASLIHGGFWNHVESVTIYIPGKGKHKLLSSDKEFGHIFGNPSRIPTILSAELRITKTSPIDLPRNKISMPEHHNSFRDNPIWFNYYCHCDDTYIVHEKIIRANQTVLNYWNPIEIYKYTISNNKFIPANIFEKDVSTFSRVGIWGVPFNREVETMLKLSSAFSLDMPKDMRFNQPLRVNFNFSSNYLF